MEKEDTSSGVIKTYAKLVAIPEKSAEAQIRAMRMPTPASRLAVYLNEIYKPWKVDRNIINSLDNAFKKHDLETLRVYLSTNNWLVIGICNHLYREIYNQKNFKEGKTKEYAPPWWV